jgi:hypothetical protein
MNGTPLHRQGHTNMNEYYYGPHSQMKNGRLTQSLHVVDRPFTKGSIINRDYVYKSASNQRQVSRQDNMTVVVAFFFGFALLATSIQ